MAKCLLADFYLKSATAVTAVGTVTEENSSLSAVGKGTKKASPSFLYTFKQPTERD